jgi:hypothetical protein
LEDSEPPGCTSVTVGSEAVDAKVVKFFENVVILAVFDDAESILPTETQKSSRLDICKYIEGDAVETNTPQFKTALSKEVGFQKLLL